VTLPLTDYAPTTRFNALLPPLIGRSIVHAKLNKQIDKALSRIRCWYSVNCLQVRTHLVFTYSHGVHIGGNCVNEINGKVSWRAISSSDLAERTLKAQLLFPVKLSKKFNIRFK